MTIDAAKFNKITKTEGKITKTEDRTSPHKFRKINKPTSKNYPKKSSAHKSVAATCTTR
jgi:hypothetical protein